MATATRARPAWTEAGGKPAWDREGRDWPNRAASRFLRAGGLGWHVQVAGDGPVLLLAHGTGAATHSWRTLLPLLARDFTVVAPDLPGHGFSQTPAGGQLSLPGMARALATLLRALGIAPALVAGHSAGAAILARMCLDGLIEPRAVVALNGAMLPPQGAPMQLFAPLARLFAAVPLVPQVFAWRAANRAVVEQLLRETGSTLDPAGVELYARLARCPGHIAGALGMMANWDLRPLQADLPGLAPPLMQVVGGQDRTVPPTEARRVAAVVPGARTVTQAGLGHLAHEERPALAAQLIVDVARAEGVLRSP